MKTVKAVPLTPEAFAPFGDVVSAGLREGTTANQGNAVRFNWAAALQNLRGAAKPNLTVFRSTPQPLPLRFKLIERHPHSSQTFLPLICDRFLICVAPARPDGEPDLDGLIAFLCGPGQGVNYHAGTWHHPIVALDRAAEFAMLIWEDGTAGDCEERPVQAPLEISISID